MADHPPQELDADDPAERVQVIRRVADALEDQDAGEAATITLDPDAGANPLPARRG